MATIAHSLIPPRRLGKRVTRSEDVLLSLECPSPVFVDSESDAMMGHGTND